MRLKRFVLDFFTILILSVLVGCSPKPVLIPTSYDFGCNQPPPDVFTKVGIDVRFAKSTFGRIVTGDVDVKSNPQIVALASKAVTDDRIRSYLRCLAIKRDGYTHEQAAYFERLSVFMSTNPTAQEFIEWQRINEFPSISQDLKLPKGFYYSSTGRENEIEIIIESVQTGENWKIYTLPNARVRALYNIAVNILSLKDALDTGSAAKYPIKWILIDKKLNISWDYRTRHKFKHTFIIVRDVSEKRFHFTEDLSSTLEAAKIYDGIIFNLYPTENFREPILPCF